MLTITTPTLDEATCERAGHQLGRLACSRPGDPHDNAAAMLGRIIHGLVWADWWRALETTDDRWRVVLAYRRGIVRAADEASEAARSPSPSYEK